MILSASRRTDIPACYSEWFFNRLREGFVLVRNPFNPRRISRVSLLPESVDGIVFWTKNPLPMLDRLSELERFPYYVQFTLTPYGRDAEPRLPDKKEALIPAFLRLSQAVGKERVLWRYDPIFFSARYTFQYHCLAFRRMAEALAGATELCTVSFLDYYRNTACHMRPLSVRQETSEERLELMRCFSQIAGEYGLRLATCAEEIDLSSFGISHAACIDAARLERIGAKPLAARRDPNQRPACGCAASVDIGAYDTCPGGCLYCYADHSRSRILQNIRAHDPHSPLIAGTVGPEDVITERKEKNT